VPWRGALKQWLVYSAKKCWFWNEKTRIAKCGSSLFDAAMAMPLKNAAKEPVDWMPILTARRRSDTRPFIKRSVIWWLPSTVAFHAFAFIANRNLIWTIQYVYRKSLRPETKAETDHYNHLPHVREKRIAGQRAVQADPVLRRLHNDRSLEVYYRYHDRYNARNLAWSRKNKERMRPWYRDWMRMKRQTDPQYLIGNRLRSRLWHALNSAGGRKAAKTEELIGCTIEQCQVHLESQFKPGMTWQNIHIDHIRPCASFDLTKEDQQRACFHFSNLQPLWAEENRRKGPRTDMVAA
jgi:hypothetical protein